MTRPLGLAAFLATLALLQAAPVPPPPRLAVVISVDQCRADYLERFAPWFTDGGFRRLLDHGAVFTEARHRHALTATAPGHAVLLSGVSPSVHGIIANDWFDQADDHWFGAVADPTVQLTSTASPPTVGASPHRFLASTVGDQLKLRHGDASRVIALANKDRAAILLGGHRADGVYWMPLDRFTTSTFYRADSPAWLDTFNAKHSIDGLFGRRWDRLLPVEPYDQVQGPDNAPGEESRLALGTTFRRTVDGGLTAPGQAYYEAFRLSPDSTVLLGALAQTVVVAEKLGQHEATDLLCLGFSQPDYVGHSFGSDSHEIMDTMLRLDRVLAEFFTFLDAHLGAGTWMVVLTADHGGCPLPEWVAEGDRLPAGRLDWAALQTAAATALDAAFGPLPDASPWLQRDAYGFHLSTAATTTHPARELRRVVRDALLTLPSVDSAWTRDELLENRPESNRRDFEAWRLSYHASRSPDVVFTPRPYVVDRSPHGSNHGTPHDYDRHVPLIFQGPGLPAGRFADPVNTEQLAPTLSRLLHVPRPPDADQPLLPHLF